jgi:hypothetical protein
MKPKLILSILLFLLLLAPDAYSMSSADYRLDWFTPLTTGGGGASSSTNYAVSITIGQSVTGAASSTGYTVGLGYWYIGAGPSAFNKTSPANHAANQSISPTLTWGASSGATGYDYCYDTTNDNTCDGGSWTSTATNTGVGLSGLTPGTTYYWQARARNADGPTDADGGTWWSFMTSVGVTAPIATTLTASGITTSGATLNGTVNANNESTSVTFQYGLTTTYGSTATSDQSPVAGNIDTPVSKGITGLSADTTYHYRVVAASSAGTTNGGDQTFKTLMAPTPGILIYLPLILR